MKKKDLLEYLTTEEAIEEFPIPAKIWGWNPTKLAAVMTTGGILGKWNNTIKRYEFTRGSIIEYIKHANRLLQNRIIDPNSL